MKHDSQDYLNCKSNVVRGIRFCIENALSTSNVCLQGITLKLKTDLYYKSLLKFSAAKKSFAYLVQILSIPPLNSSLPSRPNPKKYVE